MSEKNEVRNKLEALESELRAGFNSMFELLGEHWPGVVLPVDPSSMGIGERNFEELSQEERKVVEKAMLVELGLEGKRLEEVKVREYEGLNAEFQASVYKTPREGVFLHELVFPDDEKRWAIGANRNI